AARAPRRRPAAPRASAGARAPRRVPRARWSSPAARSRPRAGPAEEPGLRSGRDGGGGGGVGAWQADPEMGAAFARQQFDLPAVRGDVLLHDGQADARAAQPVLGLAFTAVEGFEDVPAVGRRDARAVVLQVDAQLPALARERKADAAVHRGEAYR